MASSLYTKLTQPLITTLVSTAGNISLRSAKSSLVLHGPGLQGGSVHNFSTLRSLTGNNGLLKTIRPVDARYEGANSNRSMQHSNRIRIDETFARTFSQYSIMGCAAATASALHTNTADNTDTQQDKPAEDDVSSEALRACSVYITAMDMPINTDALKESFTQAFGEVANVSIPMMHQYKYYIAGREAVDQPRQRYGFIQFADAASKQKALSSDQAVVVEGVDVTVKDLSPIKEVKTVAQIEADKTESSRKLYFHGVGINVDTDHLEKVFNQFGTVESIYLPKKKYYEYIDSKGHSTINQRRFGFITFATEADAEKALAAKAIADSNTTIEVAIPSSKPAELRQSPPSETSTRASPPPAAAQTVVDNDSKVHISAVAMPIDPSLLGRLFSAFGEVLSLQIPNLKRYQHVDEQQYEQVTQARYAYLEFTDKQAADKALTQGQVATGCGKVINVNKVISNAAPRLSRRDRKESEASAGSAAESVDSGIESIIDENNNTLETSTSTQVAEAK